MSGCDDRFQVDAFVARGEVQTFDDVEAFLDSLPAPKCDHGEDDPCEDCEAPTEGE